MDKKSKIRVVAIIITFLIVVISLIGLMFYGVFKFIGNYAEKYEFTNKETYSMYIDTEGYTLYNNQENGVSFLYPDDWIVVSDTVDEVYIANPYINEGVAGDIYYSKIDETDSLYTEEDYSVLKTNIMENGTMQFDEAWYEGDNVERCLEVNGKKTFMWYNNMNPVGYEDMKTYDLEYYSFLEGDKVAYFRISTPTEDTFNTITGTLIY